MSKKPKKSKRDKSSSPKAGRSLPAPTPADAQVVLQVYDLRREPVMRQSRQAMIEWSPRSFDDLLAISRFGAEHNAAFRQVSSYFEMVYGLARQGAVHAELLAEACGEGLLLFTKVHPYLERFREEVSPTAFRNAEWISEHTEFGRQRFALFQARMAAQPEPGADEG